MNTWNVGAVAPHHELDGEPVSGTLIPAWDRAEYFKEITARDVDATTLALPKDENVAWFLENTHVYAAHTADMMNNWTLVQVCWFNSFWQAYRHSFEQFLYPRLEAYYHFALEGSLIRDLFHLRDYMQHTSKAGATRQAVDQATIVCGVEFRTCLTAVAAGQDGHNRVILNDKANSRFQNFWVLHPDTFVKLTSVDDVVQLYEHKDQLQIQKEGLISAQITAAFIFTHFHCNQSAEIGGNLQGQHDPTEFLTALFSQLESEIVQIKDELRRQEARPHAGPAESSDNATAILAAIQERPDPLESFRSGNSNKRTCCSCGHVQLDDPTPRFYDRTPVLLDASREYSNEELFRNYLKVTLEKEVRHDMCACGGNTMPVADIQRYLNAPVELSLSANFDFSAFQNLLVPQACFAKFAGYEGWRLTHFAVDDALFQPIRDVDHLQRECGPGRSVTCKVR